VHERAVHEVEGLIRRGGGGTFHNGLTGIWKVEDSKEGRRILALNKAINCAARRKRSFVDFHGAASQPEFEMAAHLQGRITPGLEVLPVTIAADIILIFRVALRVLWASLATAPPSLRGHDMPDQGLDRPILLLKIKSKVVEKVLVKRGWSLQSKISRSVHKRAPHDMHPDTVCTNPGR